MTMPLTRSAESARDSERRAPKPTGLAALTGVSGRDDDVQPTKGLRSVAIMFRIMAGMLVLLLALQVVSGLTNTVVISYGVLFAEAIRLAIFAGLLWGAGDLANLFVKSHYDLRAMRILMGRITHLMEQLQAARDGEGDAGRERGDGAR